MTKHEFQVLRHSSFVLRHFFHPFSQAGLSLILRGMCRIRRTRWSVSVLFAAGILSVSGAEPARAQFGGIVPSSQFELADTVELDRVDNAVLTQLERVKALLADRQWDEAVEILRQLAESSEGKLLGVTNRRYVSLREWCQWQLAALPPEALKLYRARVDPIAQNWYEQAEKKGTGPICRNGPEGASHKLDLSPFPRPRCSAMNCSS